MGIRSQRGNRDRGLRGAIGVGVALVATLLTSSGASALPPGFQESTEFGGLIRPTVVRFAADGRVIVAEQSGVIKSFSGAGDTTPETVADLRLRVHNSIERGLLGMALDPNFAANNRIYVAYTYDAPIGGTAPAFGSSTDAQEPCPGWSFGGAGPGCTVSGRISRLTLNGTASPQESVLIEDWCQQYPSHTLGSLEFHGGALYASAGEGADFFAVDSGQTGSPSCGDPANQGGALRSQDLRTAGDPVTLDGTVIRIDPATGNPAVGNPGTGSVNQRRIIAYGLRNPFRFAISPGGQVWVGDVGWNEWEELNSFSATPSAPVNFGWPCYEGNAPQSDYDGANLGICETLYGAPAGTTKGPSFTYAHTAQVVPGESCSTGSSAIAGVDFYSGSAFGPAYANALFFADYVRDCIWVIPAGASSPNPFAPGVANPSFIEVGPDGALYYTDLDGGRVQRIGVNQAPAARVAASATSGKLPLSVSFDGAGSGDPDFGDTIDYAWDLDGDGQYDDSAAASAQRTYPRAGTFTVGLRRDRRRRRHRHRVGGHPRRGGIAGPRCEDAEGADPGLAQAADRPRRQGEAALQRRLPGDAHPRRQGRGREADRDPGQDREGSRPARRRSPRLGGREADRPGRGATAARRPGHTAEGRRPGRRPAALTQSSQPKQSDR